MLRRKSDISVSVDLLMPRLTAAGGPRIRIFTPQTPINKPERRAEAKEKLRQLAEVDHIPGQDML
jgi:hypothetical protein